MDYLKKYQINLCAICNNFYIDSIFKHEMENKYLIDNTTYCKDGAFGDLNDDPPIGIALLLLFCPSTVKTESLASN